MRAHILAAASRCLAIAGIGMACSGAAADTLERALVQAYQNNRSLNAQRASLRATDENVPRALSGYRPKLSVTAGGGYNYNNAVQTFPVNGVATNVPFAQTFYSRTVGATGTYTLFNGYQTANRTRQAESQVDAARETLRVTKQQTPTGSDGASATAKASRSKGSLLFTRNYQEAMRLAKYCHPTPLKGEFAIRARASGVDHALGHSNPRPNSLVVNLFRAAVIGDKVKILRAHTFCAPPFHRPNRHTRFSAAKKLSGHRAAYAVRVTLLATCAKMLSGKRDAEWR